MDEWITDVLAEEITSMDLRELMLANLEEINEAFLSTENKLDITLKGSLSVENGKIRVAPSISFIKARVSEKGVVRYFDTNPKKPPLEGK